MKLFDSAYRKFVTKELLLNDKLAAARSILANERTYLSYQRSALTFAVAGFTFIKFFDSIWLIIFGISLIPVAIITIIIGTYRYKKMRDIIMGVENENKMRQK
jgi:putative membrane protein